MRLELHRDLLSAWSPSGVRSHLNSPFALWLLSTVVGSPFGFLRNTVSEERTQAQIVTLEVQDSEFLARLRTTTVICTHYPDETSTRPMVSTLISERNNAAARKLQRGSRLATGAPLPINRLPAKAVTLIAANASFVDRDRVHLYSRALCAASKPEF